MYTSCQFYPNLLHIYIFTLQLLYLGVWIGNLHIFINACTYMYKYYHLERTICLTLESMHFWLHFVKFDN